jgi:hypothetical protein
MSESDLQRQIFEARAACYRADPNDVHFNALLEAIPAKVDLALVTEHVHLVAAEQQFSAVLLGHLTRALVFDDRLQEAQVVCSWWLERQPRETEPLRLSTMIACKRADLETARDSFRLFQDRAASGVHNGTLWMLESAMLLAFSASRLVLASARKMLDAKVQDPAASHIALEAALRWDDADLLMRTLEVDPNVLEGDRKRARAGAIIRRHLLRLLSTQRKAGSC